MRRTPGTPAEKLKLLEGLDETSLPHLVADVLFFCRGHRNVVVVDGPGDGRRDVASTASDGAKHLAQCKFHADVTVAVGARETDELPVALLKFGAKCGLFVTTARLSPQSKREYLGDFPGFELEFWDGVQLVDQVLASPLLSDLWLENGSIRRRAVSVAVPFVVRRAQDDRPVRVDPAPFNTATHSVSFNHVSAPASAFAPYRPPHGVDSSESGGHSIWCQEAVLTGTSDFRGVSNYFPELVSAIATALSREVTHTVRLGRPSLLPLATGRASEVASGDRLLVDGATSHSFVIAPGGAVHDERDWLVPSSDVGRFPANLSVAEADWAGWYNQTHDSMVMEEIRWPSTAVAYAYQMIATARRPLLEKCVFSFISANEADALKGADVVEPDLSISLANGIMLVGWMHPGLADSPVLIRDAESGEMIMRRDAGWDGAEEALSGVSQALISLGLEQLPTSAAIEFAKAAGTNLSGVPTIEEVRSAELCLDFGSIPSPIHLGGRLVLHVQMWAVPGSPAEARKKLDEASLGLPDGFVVHWQAKSGYLTKETFVMSSLQVPCPVSTSTTECALAPGVVDSLAATKSHVLMTWPDARLATLDFWTREVGFRYEDGRLIGNPYIIAGGIRYNIVSDEPDD